MTIRKDYQKSHLPAVLIVDDSDLPKTGLRMECIGKIFSHVFQRCILGYKLLALCWSDGRSQFVVDFSIHGERGKVDGKEQGLTARQRERRYNRKRDRDCQTEKRKEEYFVSKLERLKSMVKRPLEDCSPIYEGVHELTVVEKIWSIIIDVIAIVAEIFTIDENELMEQIIRDNRRFKAMQLIAQTA